MKLIQPLFFITVISLAVTGCFDEEPLNPTFDCPDLELNIGDSCTSDQFDGVGVVSENCECVPVDGVYCADLGLNVGQECTSDQFDGVGIVSENCECVQCGNLGLNVGDSCELDNGTTGTVTAACTCE